MQILVEFSEILRNFGLMFAALVGAYLAWIKLGPEAVKTEQAVEQTELVRRAHIMDLFNRAAGELSDERLAVRLAAVYVLRKASEDFPEFADPVFELLQAHLRDTQNIYDEAEPPVDVRAIAEAIRLRVGENGADR